MSNFCSDCGAPIAEGSFFCQQCGSSVYQVRQKPFPALRKLVSTALAVMGLAGLADNFVNWRDFFEVGVMVHYRDLKLVVLGLLPFVVWSWVPDYLIVGSAVASSKSSTGIRYHGFSRAEDHYRRLKDRYGTAIKIFFNTVLLPLWPLYFVYLYNNYVRDVQKCDLQIRALKQSEFENDERLKVLERQLQIMKSDLLQAYQGIVRGFIAFCFYFVIAVFLLSDLSSKLY